MANLYGVFLTRTADTSHEYYLIFLNQYPYWQLIKLCISFQLLTSHGQYQTEPIISNSMATGPLLF